MTRCDIFFAGTLLEPGKERGKMDADRTGLAKGKDLPFPASPFKLQGNQGKPIHKESSSNDDDTGGKNRCKGFNLN